MVVVAALFERKTRVALVHTNNRLRLVVVLVYRSCCNGCHWKTNRVNQGRHGQSLIHQRCRLAVLRLSVEEFVRRMGSIMHRGQETNVAV